MTNKKITRTLLLLAILMTIACFITGVTDIAMVIPLVILFITDLLLTDDNGEHRVWCFIVTIIFVLVILADIAAMNPYCPNGACGYPLMFVIMASYPVSVFILLSVIFMRAKKKNPQYSMKMATDIFSSHEKNPECMFILLLAMEKLNSGWNQTLNLPITIITPENN